MFIRHITVALTLLLLLAVGGLGYAAGSRYRDAAVSRYEQLAGRLTAYADTLHI